MADLGLRALDPARPAPAQVCAAFGLPGRPVAMATVGGAWSNLVLRLRTDRGEYAVKVLRNPWQESTFLDWVEASFLFERSAIAADVPAPAPVPNPENGHAVAMVERVDGAGQVPVRMHAWVDADAAVDPPVGPDLARWTGQVLATVHGLAIVPDPARRRVFPVPNTDVGRRWPQVVSRASLAGSPLAAALSKVEPTVEAMTELADLAADRAADRATDQVGRPVMSHGDIDTKNILVARGDHTGRVRADRVVDQPAAWLCDWDVCAPLVPREELADVACSLAAWRSAPVAHAVVRAYRDAGGEYAEPQPCDLGPSFMTGLDWLVLNLDRTLEPARDAAEAALGAAVLPGLIRELPAKLATASRLSTFLA